MPGCAVYTCKSRSSTSNMQTDGITYHSFPTDKVCRKKWITSCYNHPTWEPTRTSTICSRHFEPSLIKTMPSKKRKLVEGAIPTLYLTHPKIKKPGLEKSDENSAAETSTARSPKTGLKKLNARRLAQYSLLPQARTPNEKRLMRRIDRQAVKIRSLQSKVRYYRNKSTTLEDLLNNFTQTEYYIDSDEANGE